TFVLIAFLHVNANSFAQKITLHAKDASLEKVFSEISRQSGYDFFYNSATIEKSRLINVKFDNTELVDVLEYCFKDQPFDYSIKNKAIVVKNKPFAQPVKSEATLTKPTQQNE